MAQEDGSSNCDIACCSSTVPECSKISELNSKINVLKINVLMKANSFFGPLTAAWPGYVLKTISLQSSKGIGLKYE